MHHPAAPGRLSRRGFHLVTTALTALSLLAAPGQAAFAQAAPPATDPPARAGRVAFLQGTVSSHGAGETSWRAATVNDPVTNGNAFWTEPQAQAQLQVDGTSLWLNGGTELDVDQIDLTHFAATEPQGELYLHLRDLAPGETYALQTPRGLITMAANGRYDIVVGNTQTATTVSVLDGLAQISGPGLALRVSPNQTATISGTQNFQGTVGALTQDAFVAAVIQRERPVAAGVPQAVACMAGGAELSQYGSWQTVPQYGQVWYPQVDSDWAPYRHGHWAYVAPWGWTWVDDAPWGFAPFHYGRWIQNDNRWGWIPVDPGYRYSDSLRPIYSPALVSFFGVGAVAVGAGLAAAAFSHGNIGWVPLGPREAYYPPYRVSPTYLRRVNSTSIGNVNTLNFGGNRDTTMDRFANRGAATVVSSQVLAESRPVAGALQRVDPSAYGREHPVSERQPVAPTAATRGVTPAVARSFGFNAAAPDHAAPGPRVDPAAFQHAPGRPAAAPALRSVAEPGGTAARPDTAAPAPGAAGVPRPGEPALRAPGAAPPTAERPGEVRAPDTAAPGAGAARPGEPALRAPGAAPTAERPGEVRAPDAAAPAPGAGAARPGEPALRAPGAEPPGLRAPGAAPPGVVAPGGARPAETRAPDTAAPARAEPGAARPGEPTPPAAGRPTETRAPEVAAPARPEAPRAPEVARPAAPRVEQPRAEPPRAAPAARPEPPRAAPPRPEPPRAAPPAPRPAPPRPAAPPPRAAPPPAPHPAPAARPAPHEEHH